MWTENKVLLDDLDYISNAKFIDWKRLRGKNVLITGATGLIGSTVIKSLVYANLQRELGIRIIALVRDLKKAEIKFSKQLLVSDSLQFVQGTVEQLPEMKESIDFIIHGASPTASMFFIQHPVETVDIAVQGTKNLLELAKEKKVVGFLYLSSMEVYGAPSSDKPIWESQGCTLDSMRVRSCYPIAKRLCENLCAGYYSEYDVPTSVIRLAQTFGPGVAKDDKRVFAEFARDILEGKNIILKTAGTSKRCYLYTADAASAILCVLTRGQKGNVYNAANPDTYCSIVEMAEMVAKQVGENRIQVVISNDDLNNSSQFPPTHHLHLNVDKIKKIGWQPSRGLVEMYKRLISVI